MSPNEAGAIAIKRLLAEIRADRTALQAQRADLERYRIGPLPIPHEKATALALALDWSYTALESILDRVVHTLEGSRPKGEDWHKALLENSTLEIEGVRPAVLSLEALRAADELRRFRHFLHHAYARFLKAERVWQVAGDWLSSLSLVESDLDRFEAFLRALSQNS